MRTLLLILILVLVSCPNLTFAQLPSCSGSGQGLIYYSRTGAPGRYIMVYDPSLPYSTTNPTQTTVLIPAGTGGALGIGPNPFSTSNSPTFFTENNGYWSYYNGTTWVNITYAIYGAPSGLGTGAQKFYTFYGGMIYYFTGSQTPSLLCIPPTATHALMDIACDCQGNFYILNLDSSTQGLYKYDASCNIIHTWTISGISNGTHGNGFAIVGNEIYAYIDSSAGMLIKGVMSANNVSFSIVSTNWYGYIPDDFASCPFGGNVAKTLTDSVYLCPGVLLDTLIAYGVGPFTWSVLNGNATIYGSGDTITYSATGIADILLSTTATAICGSDSDTVHIIAPPIATMTGNTTPCLNDSLMLYGNTFSIPFAYLWTLPNNTTDTHQVFKKYPLSFTDTGYYVLKETLGNCTSIDTIHLQIKPVPDSSHISSNSPICVGDTLKLNLSNPQNGVSYTWSGPASFSSNLQNPVRTNAPTTFSGTYQIVANLNGCTKASNLQATVNPNLGPPTISISANPDSICLGQNITLTAAVSNAGNPQYVWQQNGQNLGINAASFTTGTVANGDVFTCKVSSNLQCQATDTVHSNNLSIQVIYHAPPSVYITQYPSSYSPGTTITFTGHPSYTNGLTYTWQVNGITQSSTANFFSSNTLSMGDSVCLISHSHINCTIPDFVRTCMQIGEGITTLNPTNILIYPNPVENELEIEGAANTSIKVFDVVGRIIYTKSIYTNKESINTRDWERGTYFVELVLPDGSRELSKVVK